MPPNAWVITSTIQTQWGLIPPQARYEQTVKTIASIRHHDPHAIIVLIEGSMQDLPPHVTQHLQSEVDHFLQVGWRHWMKHVNQHCMKGAGEIYMLLVALDLLASTHIQLQRVFKISGRYWLTPEFKLSDHVPHANRWVFRSRDLHESGVWELQTRLWSMCASLWSPTQQLLRDSCITMMQKGITLEQCMFANMNLTMLTELPNMNCEGYIAPWNMLIRD